jgi:hypothetical protein
VKKNVILGFVVIGVVVVAMMSMTGLAFNPVPEPPGFGLVTLVPGQAIRVNVVCSEHAAGRLQPAPCAGELMIHDAAGNKLASQNVRLMPGEATSLPLAVFREAGDSVGIDPCWIPSPENQGLPIPSAEVFDTATGRTTLFMTPVVARLSALTTHP